MSPAHFRRLLPSRPPTWLTGPPVARAGATPAGRTYSRGGVAFRVIDGVVGPPGQAPAVASSLVHPSRTGALPRSAGPSLDGGLALGRWLAGRFLYAIADRLTPAVP